MKKLVTYCMLLIAIAAFSQQRQKDNSLPKGNKEFKDKDYVDAEASYRIAQSKSPARPAAAYNLGNAIYRQKLPSEAKYAYLKAIENATSKTQKHLAYHNLGNALMQEKNYQAAVEAYKNALRNNPHDEQTRYNFALAKKMLKQNPPKEQPKDQKDKKKEEDKSQDPKKDENKGGGGDNKDKGDKGDQKDKGDQGDQKDKGDQGDQKDKGDGKEKQDKGQQGNNGQQQPQAGSPDKQRMENLLDAMNNEEKKIQDKINARRVKAQPKRQEKDW